MKILSNERRINYLFFLVFVVYVIVSATTNLRAISAPLEMADTQSYLRLSKGPLLDTEFLAGSRPFVFPLFLKIAGQDFALTSALQLGFSIIAWGLLALQVAASLRTPWLKLVAFGIILALSLTRHLAGWNFVMMTESLSISWFVLFLALGMALMRKWSIGNVMALSICGLFLAFTRDTNAYLLLMLAAMLGFAIVLRWAKPHVLILAGIFLLTFLLNNFASDLAGRWIFPFNNILGLRILPDVQAVDFFQSCGMPVTERLLNLAGEYANGQGRAFSIDPALEGFRSWEINHGKSCYMQWLLINPIHSMKEALSRFESLIAFERLPENFSKFYDPILPWFIEPFIYPVKFIPLILFALTVGALFAIWKQAWRINPLWGIYILLCLPIFPHLFITWHGDVMAPDRHAISVGLQFALSFWILFLLLADQSALYRQSQNDLPQVS